MDTEDTDDWLGIPTPLEISKQHCLLLENEIQELTTHLREARQNIFKLVKLQAETEKERDEARASLRERAGEAARLRLEVASLNRICAGKDRTNEDLRKLIRPGDAKRVR